jgi:spore maturation protein CgeB
MNYGIMSDGYIVTNGYRSDFVGAMHYNPVLDIDIVTYSNRVNIAPYHRIKPDAAIVTDLNIPNNGSVLCNEAIFSDFRINAVNCLNKCHNY